MLKLDKLNILRMTIPIMLGTFIQNIISITDSILVNSLGMEAFDAANNAGLLYIVFFMLSRGLGDGSQIQIAKEYGQSKFKEINHTLNNTFVLQFIISALLIAVLFLINGSLIDDFVKNDEIGEDMKIFLDYRSWGLFFAGFQVSILAFFTGIGQTKIIIVSSLFMVIINVFLDFGLIFGYFGLPEMGLAGAALASTIAEALTFLFLLVYLLKSKLLIQFNFKPAARFIVYKSKLLLKLSWPLMLSGFLSISTWFVFFSFIEQRSAFELEVSHVVRNLFFISFIPIFGFATTTRTYVSYYYGRAEYQNVKLAQKNLLILSIGFYLLFFHGAIFYPETLVRIITSSPEVVLEAASILQLVFGSMLLFSIVTIYQNSVAAVGKTVHVLFIEIISIVIYLLFAYYFTMVWQFNIFEVWTIEYPYFGITGILSVLYLYYFNKKNKLTNG